MIPPSPRSRTASADEVHVLVHLLGQFYSQKYDIDQMMSPPNIQASETEIQACDLSSSDFYSKDISLLPVEAHINALENIYPPSMFTNASYYDTSLPDITWASETTAAAADPHLAGDAYSPPIPTNCTSIPSTFSSDGLDPTTSNAWQFDSGALMQTHLNMPWWCDPRPSTGGDEQIRLPSRALKTSSSITQKDKPRSTSDSDARKEESEHENRTDSLHPSPPRKKKKSDGQGSYQATSNASALTIDLTYSSDPATTPMPLIPDVSFDSADTEARTNPRRSRSPRTAGSSCEKRPTRKSPTPVISRPEQRARNRLAANKCRIKTKAAIAELEATEKKESLRHEQLSMTLRSLQAEVFAIKSEILMHGACGDGLIQDYLNGSARSLAAGCGGVAECGPDQVSHVDVSSSGPMRSKRG